MKFEITEINAAQKNMEITVPSEEVDSRIEKSLKEVSKTAQLKGFRPGKAPRNMLEKFYGPQVHDQVARDLVKEYVTKATQESDIMPLVPPLVEPVELKKGKDFTFTAEIEVLPKIDKLDFEGIEIEVPSVEVADEEVQESIEHIRQGQADVKKPESERPAVMGDYLVIDFNAESEEKSLGKEQDVGVEIGAKTMPNELEDGLIGMNEGDNKTVEVTYPEDFDSPMAGKKVTFDITVKDIKERILPELDDEFAKDMGKENLSELNDHLKERICERKEKESKELIKREIMMKIREKNPLDLPPSLVEAQRRTIVEETKQRFEYMKIPFNEDNFGEEFLETARERVQNDILLAAIADSEKIEVADEEVDKRIEEWAVQAGQEPAKLGAALKAENRLEDIRFRVRQDKTVDFLMSAVTINCITEEKKKPKKSAPKTTKKPKTPAKKKKTPKRGKS